MVEIIIDGEEFEAKDKQFKSGKTGYGLYCKTEIDGCRCQVSLNIIRLE